MVWLALLFKLLFLTGFKLAGRLVIQRTVQALGIVVGGQILKDFSPSQSLGNKAPLRAAGTPP